MMLMMMESVSKTKTIWIWKREKYLELVFLSFPRYYFILLTQKVNVICEQNKNNIALEKVKEF